ncbi:MAG: hypothetical protein H7X93_14695 [Sphingomonadaceae bacterium]|nr:hypothetical protein [Sphingomonadaceae bacterium]
MRYVFPMAMAALLAACGSDQGNETANETADGGNAIETPAGEPGWAGAGEGADYALTLWDEAGAPLVSMRCAGEPRLFEVEMHTVYPIESEERLSFGFGEDALTMVADLEHPSGHVVATTEYGEDIAEALRAAPDMTASYGAESFGPVAPPDAESIAALVAQCEG